VTHGGFGLLRDTATHWDTGLWTLSVYPHLGNGPREEQRQGLSCKQFPAVQQVGQGWEVLGEGRDTGGALCPKEEPVRV
jgi:hypothetical protein